MQAVYNLNAACIFLLLIGSEEWSMTKEQVASAITYLYLKKEYRGLANQNIVPQDEENKPETNLKTALNIGRELCWV